MSDFDELVEQVEQAPTPTVEVRVLFDPDAAARHRQLEQELDDLVQRPSGSIDERGPAQVADEIAQLMDTSEPTTFRFQTLGAKTWSDLIAKHPPSKQERQRGRDVADSFWPDALAASCVEPEGATRDGFASLWEKLSDGQWERLKAACREANVAEHDIRPSQAASVLLSGRRPKSA